MRGRYHPAFAPQEPERRAVVTFRVKVTSAELEALLVASRGESLNDYLRRRLGLSEWPGDFKVRQADLTQDRLEAVQAVVKKLIRK